jgi:peptidoglycan hydrolase-like protein with peptidoglycan-binding domain
LVNFRSVPRLSCPPVIPCNDSTSCLEALLASLEAELQTFLKEAAAQGISTISFTRDLTICDRGSDVRALQEILIAAGDLHITTPTTYFGSFTQTALAEYQQAHGITPAAGYFGPKTRAWVNGH